jgi:hypothetical protein
VAQAMICDGCDSAPGVVLVTYVEEGDVKAYCPPCFGDMCRGLTAALDAMNEDVTEAPETPPVSEVADPNAAPPASDEVTGTSPEAIDADAVAEVLAPPVAEWG